jgi:hypothetical protein
MPNIAKTNVAVKANPAANSRLPKMMPIRRPVMLKARPTTHQAMRNGNSSIFIFIAPFTQIYDVGAKKFMVFG